MTSTVPAAAYTDPAHYVDSDHPDVVRWACDAIGDATDDRTRSVRLFYRVRDGIRYDPYVASPDPEDYRASAVVARERNWCVPKAVLLCAAARAVGVPARLGFADVRNHLASEKLLARIQSDLFVFHGYVEFWLATPDVPTEYRWVKATPAFNIEMCTRFGVQPIEFDGVADALYHPFDVEGRRHMEYVRPRGTFTDLPWAELVAAFEAEYGHGPGVLADDSVHDEYFHDR